MIQSFNFVATLNFLQTADKNAKELLGIYYFSKSDYIMHFIKGDFAKIIFDKNSENIIATDGR